MMINLTLPWPPSINHYWRHARGRHFISAEGKKFRARVVAHCLERGIKPLDGDLEIDIYLVPPDRRRRDLDNSLKVLLDALQHGGCYKDDCQIKSLRADMQPPLAPGHCVVVIDRRGP